MKKIISLFCLLFATLILNATAIDSQTALYVAMNFWKANGGDRTTEWTNITSLTTFSEFYIWSNDNGFVIVSGDDCVVPILGYSLNNAFNPKMPGHIDDYLEGLEQEIAYYKSLHLESNGELHAVWGALINGSYVPQATTSVSPLMSTTWDQSPRYNNLCPTIQGERTVTGCVATATAQIMKYWNWPTYGNGTHSYTHTSLGTLSADFGNTTYQWSTMPNSLTSSSNSNQILAVATLMYHIGIAIDMDYDISANGGSGATTHNYGGNTTYPCPENALINYFNYKNNIHSIQKTDVSDASWTNSIKAELDAGRPVLHSGRDTSGGHAFVCDGYDNNNLFHINWGWGGWCDGFYALNSLNPQSGGIGGNSSYTFNLNRGIVVGIEPNKTLHTNTQNISLPKAASSKEFIVTSSNNSSNWTATCSATWLTLSQSSGPGNGTMTKVTATATENNTGTVRTAIITISQGTTVCTIHVVQNECSTSDMCAITLAMHDSYGDSWNGASISVSSTSGYNYGTYTVDADYDNTATLYVCPSDLVLSWNSGSYDSECSFTVKDGNNNSLLSVSHINTTSWTINSPCANAPSLACTIMDFPWTEGFEGDVDCWRVIDADGDGNKWGLATGATNSGTYSLVSYSYINSQPVQANNYLVSPQIALPASGDYTLQFYARSANASYPDSLSVKLSTSNTLAANNFTTTLMPLTEISSPTYQQYSINLSNLNGQTFRLAFIHQSYDGMFVALDDISIIENVNTDFTVSVNASNPNMGSVTGGGIFSYGDADTLTATAYGNHRFTVWSDGNTENPRIITVTHDITYTANFSDLGDSVLQYDNGNLATNLGAGSAFYWAVRFPASELTGYTKLTDVRIFNYYAGSYLVKIYQGGSSAPGTLKASETFTLSGDRSWVDCTLSTPVVLNTSQNLWVVVYSDLSHPATAANYCGNDDGSWISFNGSSWYSLRDVNKDNTWMLRAVLSQEPIYYDVTVNSSDLTKGTVSGGGTYASGTQITLTATAAEHCHFTQWNDGNTQNPRNVTVAGNVTYTAHFATDQHQITANAQNPTMGSVSGGGTYDYGTQVTLTATAANHYHFTQWSDGSTQNPRTITVTANATYTAQFAPEQYQVTVVSNDPSMGSVSGGGTFDYGTQITLTATPYPDHVFLSWNDGNTQNPRTLIVDGPMSYIANFQSNVGIENVEVDNIIIFNNGNQIHVQNASNLPIGIYDMTGKLIAFEAANDHADRTFSVYANGIYLVKIGDTISRKIIIIR